MAISSGKSWLRSPTTTSLQNLPGALMTACCSLNLTLSICLRFLMAEIKQTFPQMAASGRDVSGEPLSIWNPVDSSSNTIMNPILHSAIRHGNCSEPCGMWTIRPASDIQSILCFAECWESLADLIRPYSNGPVRPNLPEKIPSSPEFSADTMTELLLVVCAQDCSSYFLKNQDMKNDLQFRLFR